MRSALRRTLFVLLTLGTLAGLGVACRPKTPPVRLRGVVIPPSEELLAEGRDETFRYGTHRPGVVAVRDFIIKNTGSRPMVIADVDSDCGCIATRCDGTPLQAGDSTALSVSFDSRGYYGYILKEVRILTSLSARPLVICLEAEVRP